MKKICIFGYKDALTGQILALLNKNTKFELACIIAYTKIKPINITDEHEKRPNKKTEFIENNKIYGVPVYENIDIIETLHRRKIDHCFILEEDPQVRCEIYNLLKSNNIKILSYIDPTAFLFGQNDIGEGSIIMPYSYLGYKSDLGDSTFLHSHAKLEHHSKAHNFVNLYPNLQTGGFVDIHDFSQIYISVDIINHIKIGKSIKIGAGSLVLESCTKDGGLYFGRPAKLRENNN